MKKLQVTINVERSTMKWIIDYGIDLDNLINNAVAREVADLNRRGREQRNTKIQLSRPTKESLAEEICQIMSKRVGTINWTEIKEQTGIRNMKLIREASELAMRIDPRIKISKRGLTKGGEE